MRFKLIACKVLYREFSYLSASSENYVDTTYLRQGYHDTPTLLNQILKGEIAKIEKGDDCYSCDVSKNPPYDAILIGYGLCSNGIIGLKSDKYTLVIPRAHDCITFLLGSKERYDKEFHEKPGIYWYSPGWIENVLMPSKERNERKYKEYVEQFDEDSAEFLMESEQGWLTKYENLAYIKNDVLNSKSHYEFSRRAADYLKWSFNEYEGDMSLLKDFVEGNWDNDRFLVVKPGQTVVASYDEMIIKAE